MMDQPGFIKIIKWCNYRERCSAEVLIKCRELGLSDSDSKKILHQLIKEKFIDDQRFAIQFAKGKASVKKWGKKKIENELRKRKIDLQIIKYAIADIESDNYDHNLLKIAEKKWEQITAKESRLFHVQQKMMQYLYQKGYSMDEIKSVIEVIKNKKAP